MLFLIRGRGNPSTFFVATFFLLVEQADEGTDDFGRTVNLEISGNTANFTGNIISLNANFTKSTRRRVGHRTIHR